MRKSIKAYHITELAELAYVINNLPVEFDDTLDIDGEKMDIDEYIEKRTEKFFDVPDENYREIVGKTYVNKENDTIFKVVGYNPQRPAEFYYEEYRRSRTGWVPKDYIWLEEDSYEHLKDYYTAPGALEALNKWISDPDVDMNIGREEMYMLGVDGNMYVDTDCGGNYDVYTPIEDNGATFSLVKTSIKQD